MISFLLPILSDVHNVLVGSCRLRRPQSKWRKIRETNRATTTQILSPLFRERGKKVRVLPDVTSENKKSQSAVQSRNSDSQCACDVTLLGKQTERRYKLCFAEKARTLPNIQKTEKITHAFFKLGMRQTSLWRDNVTLLCCHATANEATPVV